jgi:benzoylformate decarboxylase
MPRTAADLFTDALEQYGVEHVFGNPGTTELPVIDALADSDIEYVLGLHEDVAVGMAAGYAQTRRYHSHHDDAVRPLGVVNLHVTPGLAHGLGNLYGASVAGAPLLVTAGTHSTDFRHEEPILSGDLEALADQFCKHTAEVLDADALPTMLRRAVRTALTPPTGPVFLALPLDTMLAETDAGPERLGPVPTAGRGDARQVAHAAELLADAENPVLVVGDEIARAGHEAVAAAVAFAEATGARVHGEILACEIDFPTDHDQWVSYVPPDEQLAATLLNTDTLVFAGCSTNTTLTRHEAPLVPDDATCIHLSPDPHEIGKNQPADAAVIGDLEAILSELAALARDNVSDAEREARLERVGMMRTMASQQIEAMGDDTDDSESVASKAELVDALRAVAPDAYVVDEGVTAKYAMLTRWPMQAEQYVSNKGGGLGYGLPAAVGAAIAESMRPEPRDVLGFVGDGSYLYYPHALYSAARYDADLTVVIPDNRTYRILTDNAVELFDAEESDLDLAGTDFDPPVDIPANAESHGARGERITDPDRIADAVESALARDGPDVLDVAVHD